MSLLIEVIEMPGGGVEIFFQKAVYDIRII